MTTLEWVAAWDSIFLLTLASAAEKGEENDHNSQISRVPCPQRFPAPACTRTRAIVDSNQPDTH